MPASAFQRWPDDRATRLDQLWRVGWSAGKIAYEMDITRNSVIGKAHRMGLTADDKPDIIIGLTGEERKHQQLRHPGPRVSRPLPAPPSVPPDSLDLRLEELTSKTCKYPYGDRAPYLFCGSTSMDGSPYCGFHSALAYRGTPEPKTWGPPGREFAQGRPGLNIPKSRTAA